MPKGIPYYVTNGAIRQEFDGTDYHIVDVAVDLEANSSTIVEIIAGVKPDLCPDDPNKDEPGYCGCGVPEGTCQIYTEGVTIEPVKTKMNLNVSRQFIATVIPVNATNKTIIWSSSNTDVATVSSSGLVTAVSQGVTTIKATAQDGGIYSESEVQVLLGNTTYQAEDAEFNGPLIETNQPGYNGTGFLDYSNSSNDYIRWYVYVPSDGTYSLSFRYALGKGDRPLKLTINDEERIASISFPATGSFDNWMVYTTEQALEAGTNTITLTAIGASGGNFDELTVGNDTGISELELGGKSFVVYPNPFIKGDLSVNLKGFEYTSHVQLKISDLTGRTVYHRLLHNPTHVELNLSENLTESVYFISVESDESRIVKKLIVQ